VKAAIGNTETKSDQATQLNFDLKTRGGRPGNTPSKRKGSIWSGCRLTQAVIWVVAGSKFPTGATAAGCFKCEKSERGRFAAPSSEHGFDLRRALRPRGEFSSNASADS
jgi:hypothetical protein